MRTIVETTGTQQVDVHYVNTGIPAVIEQNFGGNYPEHGDLSLDEVLDQEIVYQSFQMNSGNDKAKASASSDSNSGHDQSGGERQVPEKDGEFSQAGNVEFQLASDEALARALQLLDFDESLSESIETPAAIDREVNSAEPSAVTSAPVVEQDNIDPDSMSYEVSLSMDTLICVTSTASREPGWRTL
ncbi:hypothetical protein HHK36_027801 [Tetracentron sinense]|uniref:Uncharacterized protein n=1 Tax=Tetracentron sinense TaxID=13715 RepID=A0A834YIE3_TETSI|nr:hypothetical protein HHK36_027801 [Tetracentron sinense]